jgi:prepilin-type N-terminal cleavage/methylation domain-containing protein
MTRNHRSAFSLVEMIVTMGVIGVLLALLLPAIGAARNHAFTMVSQSNLRNLGIAHATYAAAWSDRQFTMVDDVIARYGSNPDQAFPRWTQAHYRQQPGRRYHHPAVLLGADDDGSMFGYWMDDRSSFGMVQPIVFVGAPVQVGFGSFRIPNAHQFNQYLGGRFYDPVFYAPKDRIVQEFIKPGLASPGEYVPSSELGNVGWSSYCLSPAAMFNPDVMRSVKRGGWQDPWQLAAGFRSPSVSRCLHPSLKTRMLEHHWLQDAPRACNPAFEGSYDLCEPYYFNHGWESTPMTLFYDGHVAPVGTAAASAADGRMRLQMENDAHGLWSRDTPLGGEPDGGYFMGDAYDYVSTSFHILTTDGIRGRDVLSAK